MILFYPQQLENLVAQVPLAGNSQKVALVSNLSQECKNTSGSYQYIGSPEQ
jgi:hypothetical protein